VVWVAAPEDRADGLGRDEAGLALPVPVPDPTALLLLAPVSPGDVEAPIPALPSADGAVVITDTAGLWPGRPTAWRLYTSMGVTPCLLAMFGRENADRQQTTLTFVVTNLPAPRGPGWQCWLGLAGGPSHGCTRTSQKQQLTGRWRGPMRSTSLDRVYIVGMLQRLH
jgi:hypothetical protein